METDPSPPPVRESRSARDMVVSLLVLLLPIALLLGFYRLVLDGDEPITRDPGPAIAQARAANAFPVAVPEGLDPGEWRVTRADFDQSSNGATLRIGYVGPDEEAVQLMQSDVPADRLLPAELGAQPRAGAPVRVGARDWQQYTSRRGETALVLLQPDRTVIVVGRADQERLGEVAAALR